MPTMYGQLRTGGRPLTMSRWMIQRGDVPQRSAPTTSYRDNITDVFVTNKAWDQTTSLLVNATRRN